MSRYLVTAAVLCGAFTLSACNTKKPVQAISVPQPTSAVGIVSAVAKNAQVCWFKSKDPAFKKYKLASEVDSYIGRPRILLVPKNKPTGLPLLVVEAEKTGRVAQVRTFGPILASSQGPRIQRDIANWRSGRSDC